MARFEVVVAIYKKGVEDSIQEETVLETDDLAEATEEFEALCAEAIEGPDAEEVADEEMAEDQ